MFQSFNMYFILFFLCDTNKTADGSGDPNDPDSDNGDDDDECSTITTSDCRTDCISTSCTTTCSTYEGCEVTATSLDTTETPANYWEGTLPEPWNANTEPANAANSVASSIRSKLLTASLIFTTGNYVTSIPSITSFPSVSSPTSTPGRGGSSSSSPKVTVIYVTTTTTFVTTLTPLVLQGALTVAGVSSVVFVRKGGAIVLSNYNLNFIPPRTTFDVCSVGNFYVQGVATPRPAHWSDVPSSISFFSALTSGPTPLSSCVYKNSAPGDGAGGSVVCKGTSFPCVIATVPPICCVPDDLTGCDSGIKLLIHCDVYGTTTTVVTDTTQVVKTITTTVK